MIGSRAAGLFTPPPPITTPPIAGRPDAIMAPDLARPQQPFQVPTAAPMPNFAGPRYDQAAGRANWTETGARGVGQRVTDWMGENSGMLMRAAAGAFDGGLGGAIRAGAGYAEQQQRQEASAGQQAFENQMAVLKEQRATTEAAAKAKGDEGVVYRNTPFGSTWTPFQNGVPIADPSTGGPSPAAGGGPVRVSSAADYANLPAGAEFITPTGERRRKGGAPSQGGATFR